MGTSKTKGSSRVMAATTAPPKMSKFEVIKNLPGLCAYEIMVIYPVNCMLMCFGNGCSSVSAPFESVGYMKSHFGPYN